MTETFGPFCGARLDLDLPPEERGSCGRPFDGFDVVIVDPESGDVCATGQDGEIRVRGRNVMRTICGRTRDVIFDVDAYYPTGDLGALDAAGYLRYRGRLDDMFKVKGATVYPAEVEAALRGVDGVAQAHVADVTGEDGSVEVGALVLSGPGASATDIAAGAKARLSAFKVPTRWVVTANGGDVPRTATDKVDKAALQALLRNEGIRT
jgi:acyl-CoA synthetase (AMP-forming)/AMP-acid ligase II